MKIILLLFVNFFFNPLAFAADLGSGAVSTPVASPSPPAAADTVGEFGGQSVDFTWLFLKTIIAMVVVIALAMFVLRYLLPRITQRRPRGLQTDLEIVDRFPLDSKKALFVLRVEGRRLLIAASEHYVGFIAELGRDDEKNS